MTLLSVRYNLDGLRYHICLSSIQFKNQKNTHTLPALFSQSETRYAFQSFAAFRFANIRFAEILGVGSRREDVWLKEKEQNSFNIRRGKTVIYAKYNIITD